MSLDTFRLYFLVAIPLNNKKRFQDLFVLVSFLIYLILFFKVFKVFFLLGKVHKFLENFAGLLVFLQLFTMFLIIFKD